MIKDWITIFEALKSVYIEGAYSNIAINEAVERHKDCSIGFVRTFVKGVIMDTIMLDDCIDKLSQKGIKSVNNRTLIVLRMGIYAILKLNSVPDYAAVNSSVNLSKKVSKGSSGFVNGMLRDFIRRKDQFVNNCDLHLKYAFPESLVKLLQSQYGSETENILNALSKPSKLVLRTNLLKTSRDDLISLLSDENIKAVIDTSSRSGIICDGGNVLSTNLFKKGLFSVQSLSSIHAIEAFEPKKGEKILDMCAAPGGKTCAIAEMMSDEGEIISCDIYEHRLKLITASATRLGLKSIKPIKMDSEFHNNDFENYFDRVLADVPCSGLGVIQSKPEIKLKYDEKEIEELISTQERILKNALSYCKPGGIVEYSTCTINKKENEGVVNKVLSESSLAQILEMKTFLPYNNKVGFFYCTIKKSS